MQSRFFSVWWALLVFFPGGVAAAGTAAPREIVFGTGHRTIPKGAPVTDLDGEAYSQDLIEIVAATAGLKYRIVEKDSFPELMGALMSGEVDVVPTVARVPEREGTMLFSVPHVHGTLVVVTSTERPATLTSADLTGQRISVIRNTATYFYLQKKGWLGRAVIVTSNEAAMNAVVDGQADATVINQFAGLTMLNRMGLKNRLAIALTLPDTVIDFCMALRPGDGALLAQINDALFLAEQRGALQKNFEKWFSSLDSSGGLPARYRRWLLLGGSAAVLLTLLTWGWVRYRLQLAQRRTAEVARLVEVRTKELAEANLQLRHSEEIFSKAFRASPDSLSISQLEDGTLLEVNEGFTRLFGYTRTEAVGRKVNDLGLWRTPEDRRQLMADVRAQGRVHDRRISYRSRQGEMRTAECSMEQITIGAVECLVVIMRDVTESELAERALRESEARFRTLVESAPEAIIVFDADTRRVIEANTNALRLFEAAHGELLATDLGRLAPAVQADGRISETALTGLLGPTLRGEAPVVEWLVQSLRGRTIAVELRLVRLPAAERNLVRGSLTDITERKRLEEQLRHAQRMETVGRLAGGVAHDFNNILTVIQGNASLLLTEEALPSAYREALEQMLQSSKFAAGLTRQLLVFSRKEVVQHTSLDAGEVIQQTSRLLRRVIGEDVALEVQCPPGLPRIFADQGMIEQVLLNLAVNARDAMPRGGRLLIKTSLVEADAAYLRRVPQAQPGRHLCIAVADSGVGIAAEIQPKIFEPFFTTKEVGKGTGLGLATVYAIVQQHKGWIELDSTVHVGTEFRVHFPCLAQSARPAADPVPAGLLKAGTETILLVEDEPLVRTSSSRLLQRAGYRVLEASSPQEAIMLWAAHRGQIDLVFTDVIMPGGMTGRDLVEQLRRDRGDLKALFTSGYSSDLLGHDFLQSSINFFLQKPFEAAELTRQMSHCLRAT